MGKKIHYRRRVCTYVAIVPVQQGGGGVGRGVGRHVFARVVERGQVPGVDLGVVRASRLPADAVEQFRFRVLVAAAPAAVDPQRLFAAAATNAADHAAATAAQHAQLRQVATDHRHCATRDM